MGDTEQGFKEMVYSVNSEIQDILFQAESREISWEEALECMQSVCTNIVIDAEEDE